MFLSEQPHKRAVRFADFKQPTYAGGSDLDVQILTFFCRKQKPARWQEARGIVLWFPLRALQLCGYFSRKGAKAQRRKKRTTQDRAVLLRRVSFGISGNTCDKPSSCRNAGRCDTSCNSEFG